MAVSLLPEAPRYFVCNVVCRKRWCTELPAGDDTGAGLLAVGVGRLGRCAHGSSRHAHPVCDGPRSTM
eukprot:scaffold12713_cov146-Amphora_coffeaeformis.AAC.2